MKLNFITVIVSWLLCSIPPIAKAAEISTSVTPRMEQMRCNALLSGVIRDGDYEKLRPVFMALQREKHPFTLCLDSPGGSLLEATKFVNKPRLGTFVTALPAGSTCVSACSLIFLMGRQGLNAETTSRLMHPTAKLGVHAPSLSLQGTTFSKSDVKAAYRIALRSLLEIFKMQDETAGSTKIDIPDSVFMKMLSTPPSEMAFVKTVGDAARWGISVYPVKVPVISEETWWNFCINAHRLLFDSIASSRYPDLNQIKDSLRFDIRSNDVESNVEHSVNITQDDGVFPSCGLTVKKNGMFMDKTWGQLSPLNRTWYMNGVAGTIAEVSSQYTRLFEDPMSQKSVLFPQYLFYSSSLNISDIPQVDSFGATVISNVPALTVSGALRLRGESRDKFPTSCWVNDSSATVRNVDEFVNIRAGASLRAPVVTRANLGETLAVLSPRNFWYNDNSNGRECFRLCENHRDNPSNQEITRKVQKCMKDAQIWHKVSNARGQEGFVSVYFLEGDD